MLVEEGDAADLKADAARVGLETVLLEVPPSVAQLVYADQRAVLDFVSLALTPEAFVT